MIDFLERRIKRSAGATRLEMTLGRAPEFGDMIEPIDDLVACGGLAVVDERLFGA
ncbi:MULTISPECIES: hypothetical protein [Burkholderia]|uniref:hypothetical protein n=1 Tax=Burkholderia TaxID=32008 RepID=UPI0013625728|nr:MULTISPECIES: hypothetical protein [Burkholderia]